MAVIFLPVLQFLSPKEAVSSLSGLFLTYKPARCTSLPGITYCISILTHHGSVGSWEVPASVSSCGISRGCSTLGAMRGGAGMVQKQVLHAIPCEGAQTGGCW